MEIPNSNNSKKYTQSDIQYERKQLTASEANQA